MLPASDEPLLKWDGELGEGHDCDRLGSGGIGVEELELSHKEVTCHLKSALQAVSDVKEVGKMGKESSGKDGKGV